MKGIKSPAPDRVLMTSLVYVVSYWLSSKKSPANSYSHVIVKKRFSFLFVAYL